MKPQQTIALVTGDQTLADQLIDGLDQTPHRLVVSNQMEHFREGLTTGEIRVILIDAALDPEPLTDICQQIRSITPQPVGIIAVIDSFSDKIADLMEATVDDILVVPFTTYSLVARVTAQIKRVLTAEQLAFKVRDSWTLIEITSKLVGARDLLDSLFDMVSILAKELRATRASVVLVRPEGDLGLVVASSDDQMVQELVINLNSYPEIKKVWETAQPLIIHNVGDSQLFVSVLPAMAGVRVHSVALFPIIERENVLGVIFLRYQENRDAFSQRELVFCQTVANATSIALRNHEITESLRKKDLEIKAVETEAQSKLAALKPYEEFFLGSRDGIVVLSDTGVVIFVNPGGAAMLGRAAKDIRGLPIFQLIPKTQWEPLRQLLEAKPEDGPIAVDLHLSNTTKQECIISTTTSLLGNEGMTLLNMRDVTAERTMARNLLEAKEQLIRTEKQSAIMELAGAAAHELNQPLTAILATIAMFKRILPKDDSNSDRLMTTMEQEVDRMTGIIKRLSQLTEYTTKTYVGDAKIVDLEQAAASDKIEP